jgi:putative phosphoesterase
MNVNQNYRIGVVADTHNVWHPRASSLLKGVDEIWHLGDLCQESIVDELRALAPQIEVVLGNNDFGLVYPMSRTIERMGKIFHLIHILPDEVPKNIDWICYGHTHVPDRSQKKGVSFFNPGTVGRPNKGAPASLGFLEFENEKGWRSRIELL